MTDAGAPVKPLPLPQPVLHSNTASLQASGRVPCRIALPAAQPA